MSDSVSRGRPPAAAAVARNVADPPGWCPVVSDRATWRASHYCTGPILVHDDATDTQVYEGPDADLVAGLVVEPVESLTSTRDDALVQAAMAHLNLVMIHPFRDGNGRLARTRQTLVLARRGLAGRRKATLLEGFVPAPSACAVGPFVGAATGQVAQPPQGIHQDVTQPR